MKEASSLPPDFNPNYEEHRKRYVPAAQPKPPPKQGSRPADRDKPKHSPDSRPVRKEPNDTEEGAGHPVHRS